MKEQSIEEKARRFDEVLAMAKDCITYIPDDAVNQYMLDMFPELKAGKEGEIRKIVYGWINNQPSSFFDLNGLSKEDMLAWLEKQSETYTKKDVDNAYIEGMVFAKNELEKQNKQILANSAKTCKDEHKPVDKAEPKFKVGDVMRTLQEATDGIVGGMPVIISIDKEYYHCTNELIAIKDQNDYEYPPMNRATAWSEKDEKLLALSLNNLTELKDRFGEEYGRTGDCIEWLKSLKDRYTWKPNERLKTELKHERELNKFRNEFPNSI